MMIAIALLLMQPPPPAMHARYGPVTQCLSGYAATARADEAILAMDGGFTLAGETGGFNIQVDDGDPYRSREQATDVEVPGLGHMIRYQRIDGGADHQVTPTYLIPADAGHPAMLLRSRDFDGTARDFAVIGRISRIPDERVCGNFRAPAWPGETPDAERWQAASTPGPLFLCRNGVGFPILTGEAGQSSWWDGDHPSIRISSPNPNMRGLEPVHLVFHGPMDPVSGTGAVAETYRPKLETWFDGPAVLLMPPRTESDRHGPDQSYRRLIVISYPTGQEAAARAFAARILFVPATDSRCGASEAR